MSELNRVWSSKSEPYSVEEFAGTYVVVSSKLTWGKGKTLAEALKNAHVTSLKDMKDCNIYLSATNEIYVNGFGGVEWNENVTVVKVQ